MPSAVNRTSLALTKISTIMKSTANVESLSKESVWFMAKATEMFISHLAKETCEASANKKLNYKQLAEIVNGKMKYCFLVDIIPKKITFAEYKRIKAGKEMKSNESNEKIESGSSGDDDEEEDDNESGEDDEEESSSENSHQSD